MRVIDNKPVEIKLGDRVIFKSYFEILKDVVNSPPANGWNLQNIEKFKMRFVLNDLFKGGESVEVDESQYEEILEAFKVWGINITSREVFEFLDYIITLEKR